jgi:hypothetical protein
LGQLKETIDRWSNYALSTEEAYTAARQRASLIHFTMQLKYLVEAAFVVERVTWEQEKRSIEFSRFYHLQADLMRHENVSLLSTGEINEPFIVTRKFFSSFPLLHARAELWDLLSIAIVNSDEDQREEVLKYYECLAVIIEASFTLQNKQDTNDTNNQ